MDSYNLFAFIITSEIANANNTDLWRWLIFVLVIGALAVWIVPAILAWQRRRARQTVRLELANEGNARSRYALRALEHLGEDARGHLKLRFQANGKALLEHTAVVAKTAPAPMQAQPARSPAAKPVAAKRPAGMQQTLSSAAQTGGVVAGLLSTLGRLLPGSVGQSLTGMGREVRQGQQTAAQVKQASQYAGKLQPAGKPQPASKAPAAAEAQAYAPAQAVGPSSSHATSATRLEIWAQTPYVEPEQKLNVELYIQPANPHRTRQYTYAIESRSLEYKDAPTLAEEDGILIEALNPLERFMPFVLFAACMIGLLIVFLSL